MEIAWFSAVFAFAANHRSAGLEVAEVIPSEETLRHRNRMDFVFGPKGELGLKAPGRWDTYLDLSTCLLLSPEATEIVTGGDVAIKPPPCVATARSV